MVEEIFEKDIEIISYGDVCDKIYFIIEGKISIEIQNTEKKCWEINVLRSGDVIGV